MFTPEGIVPALVTPLTRDGDLMEDGLRTLIDYVIAGGVHGVFVLGSSGEIYGLDDAQKRRVLEITTEHVNGRVAVYAGASEITTRDCVKTARLAAQIGGVDALSVLTPYFMTPTQPELIAHYQAIAAATDLPVVLYNNPGRTKVPITVASAVELAKVDTIVGIKDSSGDFTLSTDYIRETPTTSPCCWVATPDLCRVVPRRVRRHRVHRQHRAQADRRHLRRVQGRRHREGPRTTGRTHPAAQPGGRRHVPGRAERGPTRRRHRRRLLPGPRPRPRRALPRRARHGRPQSHLVL